jgi:hypothetical protein
MSPYRHAPSIVCSTCWLVYHRLEHIQTLVICSALGDEGPLLSRDS